MSGNVALLLNSPKNTKLKKLVLAIIKISALFFHLIKFNGRPNHKTFSICKNRLIKQEG